MALIQLTQASKTYQMGEVKVTALQDADLKIKSGESIIILGPSGSGKSTMMNLIGCLDTPSKGKVFLDGKNISKMSESQLAILRGKKIGFIFQTFNLIPNLTATENVALPIEIQGVDSHRAKKRATELLKQVGLKSRASHRPAQMSGGERQRVAIARALANDPDVILADEPTGNLDSKTGKKIMEVLEDLHKKGKTIIIVTHDKSLKRPNTRIVQLKDGKITK
jgi:putative ABC transport system ATP-binding protein